MTDQEELQPSHSKSLLRKQRKREILLAKVEKTGARLERRKAKLSALEADIADLEGRLSELSAQPKAEPALADA